MATGRLIVVCGLAAEVKIAVGRGGDDRVVVIAGGGDQKRLAAEIEAWAAGAAGILSFGVAGGLAPGLRPGDIRVADLVIAPGGALYTPHPGWAASLRSGLALQTTLKQTTFRSLMVRTAKPVSNHDAVPESLPSGARVVREAGFAGPHEGLEPNTNLPLARFAGVDTPLADIDGKAALHRATGADLVDMETHVAAQIAARHSVPFAALRAITDPASRSLPHAALVGMRADGAIDLAAILGSLRRDPGQLPGLIRTGLDARAAFAALFRCRQLLGARFALLDL